MWCTPFNDLIASAQRDTSTSPNIISGLSSRCSNVILGKGKEREAKEDAALQSIKPNTCELRRRVEWHLRRKTTSVFTTVLKGLMSGLKSWGLF